MEHYIYTSDGVKIYVQDINPMGSKTILFIHGWPGNHKLFEYQFNKFPTMNYRCIGIDCRGFGKSDKPFFGYDYNRLADDIKCVIDTLELNDVILLGHSTGGAIAVRYMSRHNGYKISKLILAAAAVPSLVKRSYFPYGLPKEAVYDIINTTYNDRPKMLKNIGNMIFDNYVTQELNDWILELGLEASSWGTIAIANTWLGEEQLFDDLKKINIPTLILHSVKDKVCLFPLALAQKEAIKNSKLVKFENGGHFLFYGAQDKFNDEIVKFIEK
ncbi:MAG: alpha/beta hydrolase [Bacilli bacterium]|nr:alpha/beta hydrolase [Bacilli bacterium]